jgi:translation initiation factor IF-2
MGPLPCPCPPARAGGRASPRIGAGHPSPGSHPRRGLAPRAGAALPDRSTLRPYFSRHAPGAHGPPPGTAPAARALGEVAPLRPMRALRVGRHGPCPAPVRPRGPGGGASPRIGAGHPSPGSHPRRGLAPVRQISAKGAGGTGPARLWPVRAGCRAVASGAARGWGTWVGHRAIARCPPRRWRGSPPIAPVAVLIANRSRSRGGGAPCAPVRARGGRRGGAIRALPSCGGRQGAPGRGAAPGGRRPSLAVPRVAQGGVGGGGPFGSGRARLHRSGGTAGAARARPLALRGRAGQRRAGTTPSASSAASRAA